MVAEGGDEEENPQQNNAEREVLPLSDAVPDVGIRFLEAFGDDAGCSIQEAEQGAENAGRCFFPFQTQGHEDNEDDEPLAGGLEEL